jgi:putative ATP-dependent endonuclease of OLD family
VNISKVVIKNYRCLPATTVVLNKHLNVIVGDNECGKSTFLETVYLALSGQLNGRHIQGELHPHLFNSGAVANYIASINSETPGPPPSILIELYFADDSALARLKGQNNSLKEDAPGVKVAIEFNDEYRQEYATYVADPTLIKTVPVEYYIVRWRDFADNEVTSRSIPIKPSFIDASTIRNNAAASRYILDLVKDGLSKKEQVDLALSYRLMKDKFLADEKVGAINESLDKKKGVVSKKSLSISLDTSSRASWEVSVIPHLDDIPMTLVGKGEQNSVKIKLAMETSAESHLFLIEEAENHLSFSNLNVLIKHISDRLNDRQLIITTHSSFVLNKLGVDSVLMFREGGAATLKPVPKETYDYFMKLPGYDTLRLILAKRAILVEGPSDELIVQKAFLMKYKKMPLEMGIDVISVSSLAFKRFLEIADLLKIEVDVVTDNDGDVAKSQRKYKDYVSHPTIDIEYDGDENFKTLEPQLLKNNDRDLVNSILGMSFSSDDDLLKYMADNKTECALRFFETQLSWTVPPYIANTVYE